MRFVLATIVVFFVCLPCAFADTATTSGSPELGYGALLLRMVVGLGAVCLIAVLALKYGLARFAPGPGADGAVQVIERVAIEPRRSVVVLRVADRAVVVGVSDAGMQTLSEMPWREFEGDPPKMFHVKQSEAA